MQSPGESLFYYPYDLLTANVVGATDMRLETPWTFIEAEFPEDLHAKISGICSSINQRQSSPEVSEFLQSFEDHFVAYVRPRTELMANSGHSTRNPLRVQRIAKDAPSGWVESLLPGIAHQIDFSDRRWNWDLDRVLAKSRIGESEVFDPLSAYRALMDLILQFMCSEEKKTKKLVDHFRQLASNDESAFFETTKQFLRQYHHITTTSSDCLMPALYNMPYARELILKLVSEETGHGGFTGSSLRELGVRNPLDITLRPYAVGLMDLLRLSAQTNPLAFATLFTIFEVSGEQDEDPLAALLAKSSRPKAAEGIAQHFKLNKDGAHFMSGTPLLASLEGVDQWSVIEATRMAELILKLFDAQAQDIIEYGHKKSH